MSADPLARRLVGYFDGRVPPHGWFASWTAALRHLGVSYAGEAAHIDLSPRASPAVSSFRTRAEKELFREMLVADAPIWLDAIRATPHLRLVMIAGSATGATYINEFIERRLTDFGVSLAPRFIRRRGAGPGQTALQVLRTPWGTCVPVFFCSAGPSSPDAAVLGDAVLKHAPDLRQLIAD